MPRTLAVLTVVLCSFGACHAYTFLSVGDWGGSMLDDPTDASNAAAVASGMATWARDNSPSFVLSAGDLFYWCGIANASDPQIEGDWLKPFYSLPELQLPWYNILGNHEYGYSPSAVVDMHGQYENWILPSRYYTQRVQLTDDKYATLVMLDTSPCVSDYRSSSNKGWDPCGADYPTCSGGPTRGPCQFHENIVAVECTPQEAWLKTTLAAVPADDWLIVMGHHPAYEVDEFDLVGLLQAHPVDLYINGHTHDVAMYTMDKKGAYITTGAGSLAPVSTMDEADKWSHASVRAGKHWYDYVFQDKVAAFTAHAFNDDYTTLTTTFLDTNARPMYNFTVSHSSMAA